MGQGDGSKAVEIQQLADLCLRHLRAGTVKIICVGGLPGSGKTTVALDLAGRLSAQYLSSDEIRDELRVEQVVHPAPARWRTGAYSPSAIADVYEEMRRRTRLSVEHGISVVLDASWNDATERAAVAALAHSCSAELAQFCCGVDDVVAERRLHGRQGGTSDADQSIRVAMRGSFAPWPGATKLDTSGAGDFAARRAFDAVTKRRTEPAHPGR